MKKIILPSIFISLCMALSGCNADKLHLEKSYTVELGNKISTASINYLAKDSEKEVIKDTIISFTKDKAYKTDTKTKTLVPLTGTYLPVGKYKASAMYKEEKKNFIVEIKDTTAPKFIDFNKEVKVEQNATDVKLESYFKAEDLSKTTLTTKGNVKLAEIGKYEISVTVTDKYKNKSTNKATIEVVSMETAESEGVTEYVDGTKPISKELATKQEEAAKTENTTNNNTGGSTNNGNTGGGSTLLIAILSKGKNF